MSWINDLKIAVIEEDIENITTIADSLPKFKDINDAKEALNLIQEAIKIIKSKKEETLDIMNKIKQTKAFLTS